MRVLRSVTTLLLVLTGHVHANEPAPATSYRIDGKKVSPQEYAQRLATLKRQEPSGCKRKSGGGTVFWSAVDPSGQHYRIEITTNRKNTEESIERVDDSGMKR